MCHRLKCFIHPWAVRIFCCIYFLQYSYVWLLLSFLARSANLPKGLYIFCQCFFLYFKNIFYGRHSTGCFSESNGSIFIKISGLVDGCKCLFISLTVFLFIKGRCHGDKLESKNWRFSRTNLLCRTTIPKWIVISQLRFQKV